MKKNTFLQCRCGYIILSPNAMGVKGVKMSTRHFDFGTRFAFATLTRGGADRIFTWRCDMCNEPVSYRPFNRDLIRSKPLTLSDRLEFCILSRDRDYIATYRYAAECIMIKNHTFNFNDFNSKDLSYMFNNFLFGSYSTLIYRDEGFRPDPKSVEKYLQVPPSDILIGNDMYDWMDEGINMFGNEDQTFCFLFDKSGTVDHFTL